MPMLTTGLSLWKLAQRAVPLAQSDAAARCSAVLPMVSARTR